MSVAERSAREQRLANASALVDRCRKCEIGSIRKNAVYGEGDACAAVLVVGEGPGETEDAQGRPFIGRAGQLLERMLAAIGLAREDVFIANTVKCRPTFDDGVRLRNRAPSPDCSSMIASHSSSRAQRPGAHLWERGCEGVHARNPDKIRPIYGRVFVQRKPILLPLCTAGV